VLTATYSHLNVLHIAFNMMSLWEFGRMEAIVRDAQREQQCGDGRLLDSPHGPTSEAQSGSSRRSLPSVLCPPPPQLGSLAYLRYSLLLVVCSNALMLAAQYLQRRYRGDPQISPFTIGYSGSVRLDSASDQQSARARAVSTAYLWH
jgi:hypothetical protein